MHIAFHKKYGYNFVKLVSVSNLISGILTGGSYPLEHKNYMFVWNLLINHFS